MDISEKVFSNDYVIDLAKEIHYSPQDFEEGNIIENIEEYDNYELMDVAVEKIEEPYYYIDEEMIEEYKEMNTEKMPPIILGFYSDGTYQIIDGGHRVTVAQELGLKKIKAYVGMR